MKSQQGYMPFEAQSEIAFSVYCDSCRRIPPTPLVTVVSSYNDGRRHDSLIPQNTKSDRTVEVTQTHLVQQNKQNNLTFLTMNI